MSIARHWRKLCTDSNLLDVISLFQVSSPKSKRSLATLYALYARFFLPTFGSEPFCSCLVWRLAKTGFRLHPLPPRKKKFSSNERHERILPVSYRSLSPKKWIETREKNRCFHRPNWKRVPTGWARQCLDNVLALFFLLFLFRFSLVVYTVYFYRWIYTVYW